MPKVLNRKHSGEPKGSVYIGRPSKWGNPYRIGQNGSREEVIELYRQYLHRRKDLLACLHELRGKDLVCFCAPLDCHGDILLKLAND